MKWIVNFDDPMTSSNRWTLLQALQASEVWIVSAFAELAQVQPWKKWQNYSCTFINQEWKKRGKLRMDINPIGKVLLQSHDFALFTLAASFSNRSEKYENILSCLTGCSICRFVGKKNFITNVKLKRFCEPSSCSKTSSLRSVLLHAL